MNTFEHMMCISQKYADSVAKIMRAAEEKRLADNQDFETDLINASMEAEVLCRNLRKILIQASIVTKNSLTSQLCSIHDIHIEESDGKIHLTLPVLPLKKPDQKNCSFLIDPLMYYLQGYTNNNTYYKFDKARITICHRFPENIPFRKIRDYDNIEVKKLLDVLALYFLKDDNMACCEVLHTTLPSDEFKTEITIERWS